MARAIPALAKGLDSHTVSGCRSGITFSIGEFARHGRRLPGGRYATVTHVGHPMGLMLATKELLDWGAAQGLKWDVSPGAQGEQWGCRLENYLTDPGQEPDMSKWETQLAFRLAD